MRQFFLTVLRCVSAWRAASSSQDRPARCWEKHLVMPHELLSLAEPGQVIIAAGTRRLSGSLFAYREIGPVTIKASPVRCRPRRCSVRARSAAVPRHFIRTV